MLKQYPKHKYILALADYCLLIASFFAAAWLRFADRPLADLFDHPYILRQSLFMLAYSFVWVIIFQHFNLYKMNVFLMKTAQIIAIIKGLFFGLLGMIVFAYALKGMDWIESRAVMVYFAGLSFISLTIFRTFVFQNLFRLAARKRILRRRVVVIGTDETAKMISLELDRDDSHGFEVVGFVDDALEPGARVFENFRVLGSVNDLKTLVREQEIQDVIIAQSEISPDKLLELIDVAKETKANVRLASEVYRIIPEKIFVEKYLGVPVVLMAKNDKNQFFNVYKRIFDFLFSVAALLFLALPFLLIAVLIRLTSKGPVFFRDRRIGKGGKSFTFYKFRTMNRDNDDSIHREFVSEFIKKGSDQTNVAVRKITHDPRVTKVGRFLRKTSFDELPQLFNVLRGEMSLVGPRPCLPYEWEQYAEWHRRRLTVTPGCTGLWQVSGRSAVDFNDMVILDLFYIHNMSPLLDLKIIFRTIPVMLLAKGGY